ncbi:MAG: TonB-dependent receptor, partial [Acidobacteria bacterium]|nr:TonB-dependent receptor [Acidobacteriota bacterium]
NASAAIAGQVTDQAGAVVAGAEVSITNTLTGVSRKTTTSIEGIFSMPNLPPGPYEVQIRAASFPQTVRGRVELRVGQQAIFNGRLLVNGPMEIVTDVRAYGQATVDTSSSTVDGVVSSQAIGTLPLNGRNYLELALLVPGNLPAPNFDPTKAVSVIVSSAGQLGRGGNITIDGADNNDDAVGGPLINISQDAVQEFQIATNRFSADQGRSASSVINVVTRSGSNQAHGSLSLFQRDRRLQGLPATFDRSGGSVPPFDRQQYAATLGGPLARDRAWLFGAFEYRNQDGAVLVGERDVAARRIRRTFAPAPLDNLLGMLRGDLKISNEDLLMLRYAIERIDSVGAAKLDRAIGSASQRQRLENNHQTFLANWTRTLSPYAVNSLSFSTNNFFNDTTPLTTGPQLTFPSIQDGVSFRVPQATEVGRLQLTDTLSLVRGAHTIKLGGDYQRVRMDLNLGVFRQGRIEFVQDFAQADFNGDGRIDDNDLLFAVTLRSSRPSQSLNLPGNNNQHIAGFVQDDWRLSRKLTLNLGLRYELDTNLNNISGYGDRNPLIQPFLRGERRRDLNNFAPRLGFNWATADGRTSIHGGYGIYYDRITLQIMSLERGLDGRALA